jgi:hypothetical protein
MNCPSSLGRFFYLTEYKGTANEYEIMKANCFLSI